MWGPTADFLPPAHREESPPPHQQSALQAGDVRRVQLCMGIFSWLTCNSERKCVCWE